ncbi:unnamed protein product, partial [marine sediment metagenome]
EAFRVGKKILIGLPNCIHFFSLVKAFFGKEMGSLLGMPPIRPQDRHKWFFTAKQADVLMGYYAAKYSRRYEVYYFTHPKAITILNRLNPNLFCHEMLYVFGG